MSSTTLTGATISPAATRVKTSRFTLRKHDFVGIVFGLIAISPVWLALFTNKALSLWITYGATQSIRVLVAFEIAVLLAAYPALKITMPKDGAK